MSQNAETTEQGGTESSTPAPPITSRFLFVDVAAQRAKQLRRGARPRLDRSSTAPHKLERLAMEEVRAGLIQYSPPTGYEGVGGLAAIQGEQA